jgi:hypothetical protein
VAHDLRGLVVHRDDAGSVAQGNAAGKAGMALQQRLKHILVAVQDHVHVGMARDRIDKAGNNRCRPAIATHGVNGNDYAIDGNGRARFGSGGHVRRRA